MAAEEHLQPQQFRRPQNERWGVDNDWLRGVTPDGGKTAPQAAARVGASKRFGTPPTPGLLARLAPDTPLARASRARLN